MINEATVDGEDKVLARIFAIRCSLHGASLLIGGILCKCFASAVGSSRRIFRMFQIPNSKPIWVTQDSQIG